MMKIELTEPARNLLAKKGGVMAVDFIKAIG